MAQQSRPSSSQPRPKTSSVPVFPIFENHLKMIRFSNDETELLEKCTIPVENGQYLQKPSTSIKQLEKNLTENADLTALDDDCFWKMFNDSGDFNDMLTELNRMSVKQSMKRKKKRSERWQGSRSSSSDKGGSRSRHSSSTGDINARRVSPDEFINHKTILAQHVPSDATVLNKEEIADLEMKQKPEAIDSNRKHAHQHQHANLSDHSVDGPRSSRSKHSSWERHDYSSKHHRDERPRSGRSKHSSRERHNHSSKHHRDERSQSGGNKHGSRSESGHDDDKQMFSDYEVISKNRGDYEKHRSRRSKRHREKEFAVKSQTPAMIDRDEAGPSPARSWSSRMECNSSDSSTQDGNVTKRRSGRHKRTKEASMCSGEEDGEDKNLGRNMRAAARRGNRKLRT